MAPRQELLNNVFDCQLLARPCHLLEKFQGPKAQDLLYLTHLHWMGLVQLVSVDELESLWES